MLADNIIDTQIWRKNLISSSVICYDLLVVRRQRLAILGHLYRVAQKLAHFLSLHYLVKYQCIKSNNWKQDDLCNKTF